MARSIRKLGFIILTISVAMVASQSHADRDQRDKRDKRDRTDRQVLPAPDYRVDKRFDHNRSYPRDGYKLKVLPERRPPIHYRDRDYFYFRGVWYLPSGPEYVVVRPPVGIVVPLLPPFYTTIWFHGVPYYYANEVYYQWRPDLNGYQVTEPPADTQPEPAFTADELYIYPKQGQSEQQQADDRYACHRWGVEQSKYDPTQPPVNVASTELSQMREAYQRAMKACLEGKGYSVR